MKKKVEFLGSESIDIGKRCILYLANGDTVQTSRVISYGDNYVETNNTLYIKKNNTPIDEDEEASGKLYQTDKQLVFKTRPDMDQSNTTTQNQSPNIQVNQPTTNAYKQQIIQQIQQENQPPVQQVVNNPQMTYKQQFIQDAFNEQNNIDPRMNQYVNSEPEPDVKPKKINLNRSDAATRLKAAKCLKIIEDVPSDRPDGY